MNSKDFILALRKVIREEVQLAVQTTVRKEISKLQSIITESQDKLIENTPINNTRIQSNTRKLKQYTSNTALNEILNETVGHIHEGNQVDYINHNDFSEWPTLRAHPMQAQAPRFTDMNGSPVDLSQLSKTEAGAEVANALTKNYSALMKAIDKKKGK